MITHKYNRTSSQQGQAMTELNIVAAFVLLPLFLLIPIMGKYIDIKHTTVQSARYVAWERTAYFPNINAMPEDVDDLNTISRNNLPTKTDNQLQREAVLRFFGPNNENAVIVSSQSASLNQSNLHTLWRDHTNQPLINTNNLNNSNTYREASATNESAWLPYLDQTSSLIQTPMRLFVDGASWVARQVNNVGELGGVEIFDEGSLNQVSGEIPFLPDEEFPKNNFYTTTVSYQLNTIASRNQGFGQDADQAFLNPFDTMTANMSAQSGLLTDTWSSFNSEMFQYRTEKRVPSSWLRPFFEPLQNFASATVGPISVPVGYIFEECALGICVTSGTKTTYTLREFALAPELSTDSFIPGFVDTTTVRGNREEPDCRFAECSYDDKENRERNAVNNPLLNTLLNTAF